MKEDYTTYFNSQAQQMKGKTPPIHEGCKTCPVNNFWGIFRSKCLMGKNIGMNNITKVCQRRYVFKADLTIYEWIGPIRTTEHPEVAGVYASSFDKQDDSHVG